jgi:phosphoadenosine phosphosulfate reductase
MHVTMVKKLLADGKPCQKCIQAEELLKARGLWSSIDEVVWAIENDASSPGMQLAAQHRVDLAPFFIVRDDQGERVHTSTLKLVKELAPIELTGSATTPAADPTARLELVAAVDLVALAGDFDGQSPQAILRWGLERFGADLAIAFSGAEDVALIDMAVKLNLPFSVFCLDTGRLHAETYRFLDQVRNHYGIELQVVSPDPKLLEPFVRKKGLFSFYEDGHGECCAIRKVEPLQRALAERRAWATGQRKDQSPSTRSDLLVIEADPGKPERVKLNPLANWTRARVWDYIEANQVPHNPLHDQGFISIGCEPCTRVPRPGEHERAGRWWWEEETRRECGLHLPK